MLTVKKINVHVTDLLLLVQVNKISVFSMLQTITIKLPRAIASKSREDLTKEHYNWLRQTLPEADPRRKMLG